MNLPTTGLMDPIMLASIAADVASVLHDTDTATSLVFTANGGRIFDPKTMTADYAETSTTVSAWVSDCTQSSMVMGAQPGDVQVLIALADLASTPHADDRFTISSGTRAGHYAIRKAISGPLATHHLLFAFRVD